MPPTRYKYSTLHTRTFKGRWQGNLLERGLQAAAIEQHFLTGHRQCIGDLARVRVREVGDNATFEVIYTVDTLTD